MDYQVNDLHSLPQGKRSSLLCNNNSTLRDEEK